MGTCQAFHIILYRNSFLGQQSGEGIAAFRVMLYEAGGQLVLQIAALLGVHQFYFGLGAILPGEDAGTNLVFLIDHLPNCLEGQSVDEIQDCLLRDLVQDLGNHAGGVLFDPIVDVLFRGIVKGSLVDPCTVVVGVVLQKVLLDLKIRIILEPDGICQVQLAVLPLGQKIHVGQHEADIPSPGFAAQAIVVSGAPSVTAVLKG